MLLRASSAAEGHEADVHAVTGETAPASSGVAGAEHLVAFAEAIVGGAGDDLERARAALLAAAGPEQTVDAAAVASNFERMVRIADATGIPLDTPLEQATADLRADLGLDRRAAHHAG